METVWGGDERGGAITGVFESDHAHGMGGGGLRGEIEDGEPGRGVGENDYIVALQSPNLVTKMTRPEARENALVPMNSVLRVQFAVR